MKIDSEFLAKWKSLHHDKEDKYNKWYAELLARVRSEVESGIYLCQETLHEIISWKAARSRGKIDWNNYQKYQNVFSKASGSTFDVHALVGLPGFGYPYASTVMHFAFPNDLPIVDVRTIGALKSLRMLEEKDDFYSSTCPGYEEYVKVIRQIVCDNQGFSMRDIDMALYAYNKYA